MALCFCSDCSNHLIEAVALIHILQDHFTSIPAAKIIHGKHANSLQFQSSCVVEKLVISTKDACNTSSPLVFQIVPACKSAAKSGHGSTAGRFWFRNVVENKLEATLHFEWRLTVQNISKTLVDIHRRDCLRILYRTCYISNLQSSLKT